MYTGKLVFSQILDHLPQAGFYTTQHYPDKLRRIKYYDVKTGKRFVFLTNNFSLSALTITEL